MTTYYQSESNFFRRQPVTWTEKSSDFCGEIFAIGFTGITRIVQIPVVAGNYFMGNDSDNFRRASDEVGEIVGRKLGEFIGATLGGIATATVSVTMFAGSALFDLAKWMFERAIELATNRG